MSTWNPDAPTWERLTELLEAVTAIAAPDRAAWLDNLPPGDAPLRAELESLLATLPEVDPLFDQPARMLLPDSEAVADPESTNRFGNWSLIREIGRGGMGSVWEASRTDSDFDQRAALKVVRAAIDSPETRQRFRQERQLLARLRHPNIATLLDGGVTADGMPWFAMELVEGEPITTWCAGQRLGIRARLELFRQVCSAVHHAHRALAVHRDLKPGNILVTPDGTVKLLDFGIATLLTEANDDPSDAAHRGGTPGTPAYVAPELLRGEPVSTAADVYALGVVCYELLTERVPFPPHGKSQGEWLREVLEQAPPPLSADLTDAVAASRGERSADALRRVLSGDLEFILAMALRKEPDRRYASAEQLSEDIARYLSARPVIARTESLGYHVTTFVRRNRAASIAGAIALIALAGGLAATAWQAHAAGVERDRARIEATKARRVTEFVTGMLGAADPRASGRNVTVAEALTAAEQRAMSELRAEPEVLAAVLSSIGRTYLGLGRYDDADRALHAALRIQRQVHASEIESLRYLAALDAERGNIPAADSLLRQAMTLAQRPPVDSVIVGALLDARGSLEIDKGEFATAEGVLREALAMRQGALGPMHVDVATTLNNLGVAVGQQNRWPEAIPLHEQALVILRTVKGRQHPDVASGLNTLANGYTIIGNYRVADTLFREALAQRIELLGTHHSDVAWTRYSRADMLRLSGDYEGAAAEAKAVLAERGTSLPESHPMISAALQIYGRSLMALGRATEAEAPLRESLRLRTAAYPVGHWLIASGSGAVGECLLAQKRYADAEPLLRDAWQALDSLKGPADQRTRELFVALAEARTHAAGGN